jgi:hypothetical protein
MGHCLTVVVLLQTQISMALSLPEWRRRCMQNKEPRA